jgi:hypothetical protein
MMIIEGLTNLREVYFAEMAATKPPTHGERIEALEKAVGSFHRKTKSEWLRANWLPIASLAVVLRH